MGGGVGGREVGGGVGVSFCSLVDNISVFFQTCSRLQRFSGCRRQTPQATETTPRKTFSVLCNSPSRAEQSRAMWKTLKVKKPGGDEDGLLEEFFF